MKNKGKKISKASKAIINQKPMTYVTARHPKTASNLSKPITKKTINQELEAIGNQTNQTVKHPKTVTKLSKPVKQSKTIT